jgi:signal peptidase
MGGTGMGWQRLSGQAIEVVLLLCVVAIITGAALGQPILLGYVETGSMEPTLAAGDGFVAVPATLAGQIEEGDVVVFRAEEVNDGKLTTHRVVEETDRGYITKGDANPFTDQDADEPPVKDAQIVATALQIDGQVIAIPQLGAVVTGIQNLLSWIQLRLATLFGTRALLGTQGLAYLLLAVTLLLYVADVVIHDEDRRRDRDRSRNTGADPRLWIVVFGLVVVFGATAAMVAPAGPQEYGIVSAEFDSEGARVIPAGETETTTYPVGNGGVVPVVSYFEPGSEGVEIEPDRMRIGPGETANATLALSAPPETGYYRRFVVQHRYLAILPGSVIDTLYPVHPWAPLLAIDALLFAAFTAIGLALVGRGRVRDRTRRRGRIGARLLGRMMSRRPPAISSPKDTGAKDNDSEN